MSNYNISQTLLANIIQNMDNQLNTKKMQLIALNKEITDLDALRTATINSPKIE